MMSRIPVRSNPLLTTYASAPTDTPCFWSSGESSEVTRTTGRRVSRSSARIFSVRVKPFIRGISMSETTRSNGSCFKSANASIPSVAVWTRYPSRSMIVWRNVREVTESSTTRTDLSLSPSWIFRAAFGLPLRDSWMSSIGSRTRASVPSPRMTAPVIRRTRRSDRHVAVLYIDLDQFKRINDTLGHSVGDALLKSVGARLESSVRASDFVARVLPEDGQAVHFARLGGDEFVALITGARSHEEIDGVAARILETLGAPFRYEEHQLVVTPSIGVAVYPEHGRAVEDLLMHADAAMYQAKAAGPNRRCFYSSTMTARSLERLELENDLRVALAGGTLQLYYQPKIAVASGRIHGVEALLRWHHPERGWIAPSQFIPLAEETGLIARLGEFVLECACRQVRAWELAGLGVPHVAVNVSSQQFAQGAICDVALRKVWEAGIRPEAIQLEITESLMLQDVDENIGILRRLREAGFSLAVDDFGTGYSSLSYLKKFPIDALKIDRSFVCDLHTDHDDAAICAAILAMAHELGLEVVAEGVENEEQLDFLRRHHCDVVQGYLTGVPLPAAEVEQAIRAGTVGRLSGAGAVHGAAGSKPAPASQAGTAVAGIGRPNR